MLNLLLTIAIQSAAPVYCTALFVDGTQSVVPCSCRVEKPKSRDRVCESKDFAPNALVLKEVSK